MGTETITKKGKPRGLWASEIKRNEARQKREAFDARWDSAYTKLPKTVKDNLPKFINAQLEKEGSEALTPTKIYNTRRRNCRNAVVLEAVEKIAGIYEKKI
jgi:hypothetical protein